MRKALLLLALTMAGEAQATVPFNPKPDPLCKVITVPLPKDTFAGRMAFISRATGVKINIDSDSLRKHGMTKNHVINRLPPEQPAIDLIVGICKDFETVPGVLILRREEDGSLTITAK